MHAVYLLSNKSLKSTFSRSAAILLTSFFQSILASVQLQTRLLLIFTLSYELAPTLQVLKLPVVGCNLCPVLLGEKSF